MSDAQEEARILICEDEVLIAKDLTSRLKGMGYKVCAQATSGEQVLELVEQHQPDLVMMDIVLHGEMDGIDTAAVIKDKWGIPVVFLTAYTDIERLERAKLTYPFGYIVKPFQDRDLRITVEMALYVAKVDKERKKVEEKNQFQAKLLDSVGQSVIATDVNGTVIYWNKAAEAIYGYSQNEAIGRNNIDIISAEQSKEQAAELMNFLTQGKSWSGEFFVKNKIGKSFPVYVTCTPISNESGSLAGIIGVSSDITDRKQAEETIKVGQEKFHSQYQSSPIPIFTWEYINDDFILTDINKAALELTKGAANDFIQKRAVEIYPDRSDIINNLKKVYNDKQVIKHESAYFTRGTKMERIITFTYTYAPPNIVMMFIEDITRPKNCRRGT